MGFPIRVVTAAMILALLSGMEALAQRPPKYVRTPYVEVYRDPFGGKHIRTPFAEIHKPGRLPPGYVGPPIYPYPEAVVPEEAQLQGEPQPSRASGIGSPTPATDFGQMDWQSLRRTIYQANQRLNEDLARSPSGDFWKTSLKTDEITRLIGSDAVGPPKEPVREQLLEIANTLDALSGDPQGNSVVRLASYRNLRGALREYTLPADIRAREQLYAAAAELSRSLEQFSTASTWKRYFALTPGSSLAPDQRSGESAQPTPDFVTLLGRFESASQDPQYSMIATLPAFERTRNLLQIYVGKFSANEGATAEELPAPLPVEARNQPVRR